MADVIPVVFPSSANWFFEDQAMTIAEDLSRCGFAATPVRSADLPHVRLHKEIVFVVSFGETLGAAPTNAVKQAVVTALRAFKRRILINYDSVMSPWFRDHLVMGHGFFSDIFDVSPAPQTSFTTADGAAYHWIPETFSTKDRQTLTPWSNERPLPWALIGHETQQRSALISALVKHLSPSGFVFSPPLMAYDGTYGLDRQKLRSVIERSRLYIWGSYHTYPYHEALRALNAIQAGTPPVKLDPLYAHRFDVPWVFPSINALKTALADRGAEDLFRRSRDHVLSLGTIGENFAHTLRRIGF